MPISFLFNHTTSVTQHQPFKPSGDINKDIHILKVKEWKKIFHAINRDKKAGVAVLVSDKIGFQKRK